MDWAHLPCLNSDLCQLPVSRVVGSWHLSRQDHYDHAVYIGLVPVEDNFGAA